MATNEGDRQVNDIQVQKYMDRVLQGKVDAIRNDIWNILQQDRIKTAEINLLTREIRVKQKALERIKDSIVPNITGATIVLVMSLAELRDIAQAALDWQASDPE